MSVSVAEFLKGLPSYNENNFTKFHVDNNSRCPQKRPSVYIPTKDFPAQQVIVTEKTSILLRYIHQHWDKKVNDKFVQKKRENTTPDSEDQCPSRKRPRTEYIPF